MMQGQCLTARAGDKLDLLLWREAGLGPVDLTRVYDTNPGLSDLGPILPPGTQIIVPPSAPEGAPRRRAIIQLWD